MTPLRRRVRVRAAFPLFGGAARLAGTTALFLLAGCYSRATPAPTAPVPSRDEARAERGERRRADALPAPGASLVIPVRGSATATMPRAPAGARTTPSTSWRRPARRWSPPRTAPS
jgi:hypothetical protein